jgi:hypothetical protein
MARCVHSYSRSLEQSYDWHRPAYARLGLKHRLPLSVRCSIVAKKHQGGEEYYADFAAADSANPSSL